MLDLKKLALKLEEALESETAESLNAWLATQRTDNIENYVGEGEIIILPEIMGVMPVKSPALPKFGICDDSDCFIVGEYRYDAAA